MPQSPSVDEVAAAFCCDARAELEEALKKIKHCLDQLSDQQIWWRADESRNSIGNLILHLCGNLRQWITSGIGGAPYVRNRPNEFSERRVIPRVELIGLLEKAVEDAGKA